MTVYLCTNGTSAGKNLKGQDGKPLLSAKWVRENGGVPAAAERIWRTFAHYELDDETARRRHLSAEIHSLARMGVTATDRVVLFSSETDDGQACAEAVRLYLLDRLPGVICEVKTIPGLQVQDASAFRTQGVVRFTRDVLRYIAEYGAEQCVLNPTGGFKSLVPYTVLIGMIKGIAARYIFEQSSALIDLPRMPVEFARERLEPWLALIEHVERESYVSREEWNKAIPYEERPALQPLFEFEGDQVTLSPVGLLIWEENRQPAALVPYLSRAAIDDLVKLQGMEGCKPLDYLQRVTRNPMQLANAKHAALGGGLFWLKPGQHTRDRYLVSQEGWRLLVWRMTDHDEYENLLQQNRNVELGPRMLSERRSKYEPFFRLDTYPNRES